MKLSPEVIAKIEAFVDAAKTDIESTAASMNVGRSSMRLIISLLRKLGADIPKSSRERGRVSRVDIDLASRLLARGVDKKAVAEKFGIKVPTLNLHLRKAGVTIASRSIDDVLKELGASAP